MKRTKMLRAVGALGVVALLATACGSDDPETTPTDDATDGATDDTTDAATDGEDMGPVILSTYITEPEHLSPPATNESEGNAVLSALFKGLIDYDVRSTEPILVVADSITTEDNQTYTVTVADGWTFHDGTPVTAESFVKAWNFTADADNADVTQTASFFAAIEGWEAVNTEADGDSFTGMSGLALVDEMTFTITLAAANPTFPVQLGYTAYYPLPEAFYADPAAFENAPIGNGPFMMDGTWEHDVQVKTVKYDGYAGADPAQIDGLTFKIYADQLTAYNDLVSGNLDIMDSLPTEQIEDAKGRFGDRFQQTPSSSINYLGLPTYVDWLQDVRIRAALSMAIDQAAITETIFNNDRKPAYSMINPVIPGHRATVCDNWSYDPDAAKAMWDEAGGYDGPIEMWFNQGAGHDDWVEAVSNQWINNLGVNPDQISFQTLDFSEYLPKIDNKELTGPFRLGWGMDYPHPENYTYPMFHSESFAPNGSNATFFDNADFDAAVDNGVQQTSLEEAIPFFQQAEDILCAEVPVIPMFFGQNQFASSERVANLYVDAFGNINYTEVTGA